MTTDPLPPPPTTTPTGNKKLLYGLLAFGVLLVVVVIIGAAARGDSPGPASTTSTLVQSTTTATTAAPTTTAPDHTPVPEEFGIEVVELSRSCFGSAGCNITYKIVPTYIGATMKAGKTFTVIYEVYGGDDTKVANFRLRDGDATFSAQEHISTPSNPTLTAKVTRVVS